MTITLPAESSTHILNENNYTVMRSESVSLADVGGWAHDELASGTAVFCSTTQQRGRMPHKLQAWCKSSVTTKAYGRPYFLFIYLEH